MCDDERCPCDINPLCVDCGVDTYEIQEFYMVHERLWEQAVPDPAQREEGQLCIGCLEKRLGRRLIASDFPDVNANFDGPSSMRLRERLHAVPAEEYAAQKQRALADLRTETHPEEVVVECPWDGQNRTASDLIQAVEQDAPDGRDFVRLVAAVDRREARKLWNRIRAFFRRFTFRIPPEDLHVKP